MGDAVRRAILCRIGGSHLFRSGPPRAANCLSSSELFRALLGLRPAPVDVDQRLSARESPISPADDFPSGRSKRGFSPSREEISARCSRLSRGSSPLMFLCLSGRGPNVGSLPLVRFSARKRRLFRSRERLSMKTRLCRRIPPESASLSSMESVAMLGGSGRKGP